MQIGEHAVVLGGSLSGLASAAVLAQRFERVTVVERDRLLPTGRYRKGVPQGRHVHVLQPAGLQGLAELFPGILDELRARGAHVFGARALRFNLRGGSLRLENVELEFLAATRLLLEGVACERVRSLANVRFADGCDACGLTATPDRSRVTGVRLRSRPEQALGADLVVDATGRGSRSQRWQTLRFLARCLSIFTSVTTSMASICGVGVSIHSVVRSWSYARSAAMKSFHFATTP